MVITSLYSCACTQVEGILLGDTLLHANMTIGGESAEIDMQTDHQPTVFSVPG